jgi:hypothetical protein
MLDALGDTYSMLIAFYLAARLFMAFYYFCLAWVIPMVRAMMLVHIALTIIPSVLWIGSIYIDMPQRLALIWIAIFIELCGAMFVVMIIRNSNMFPKPVGEWLDRVFEFFPAINIEHKVERTNAFVTLVFGYSVVAIIYQNAGKVYFHSNLLFPSTGAQSAGAVLEAGMNPLSLCLGAWLFSSPALSSSRSGKSHTN